MRKRRASVPVRSVGVAWRARGARRHLAELPYLAPVALLLAAFTFVPAAIAWRHAFTAWNPGYNSPFIGLDNFRTLFADPTFREVLGNQVIFLLGVPLWVLLPLALSLLLYERVPAAGFFRTILFFPAVLPPTIIAIMFRSLLAPDGLVNDVLRTVGLGGAGSTLARQPRLGQDLADPAVGLGRARRRRGDVRGRAEFCLHRALRGCCARRCELFPAATLRRRFRVYVAPSFCTPCFRC